jgi:N6-adenosine-specific RNA methylase IME4
VSKKPQRRKRNIYQAAAARRKNPLAKSPAAAVKAMRARAAAKKKAADRRPTPKFNGHFEVRTKNAGFSSPIFIKPGESLHSAAQRALATRLPSQIKVGKRFRKDKGDLKSLARSIDDRGALLEPIVIDKRDKLIDGERRLLAWSLSKFAGTPIAVHVVDIDSIVAGEYDANAQRKDFNPAEAVAIKRALEPLLKKQAKDRQREHGGTTPGRKAESAGAGGRAADHVARIVGKDRKTIAKAEAIVVAAEAAPNDQRIQKLVDDMNRTGRVNGPHKRLQIMQQTAAIRRAPPGVPMKGPYSVASIDFPWPNEPGMTQEEIDAAARSLRPYPAMSIKAGCAFMATEVKKILAKDAVVCFWTTNFHAPYAFHLLQALGFRKHSTIGCWTKDKMGRGQVLRDKTELCIIAIKGKPVVNLTNQTTDWSGKGWERRENSRKPDAFYDLVEELFPAARYAEIFSRGGRNSKWDCHGDEIGKYPPITEPLPLPLPEPPKAAAPKSKRAAKPKATPAPLVKVDDTHQVAAAYVTPSEQEAIACRERLKDLAVRMAGRHVVSMTNDAETANDRGIGDMVGTCACGDHWQFPRGDYGRMDLAIEQHWLAVLATDGAAAAPEDQLDIPGFLRREPDPPAARTNGSTTTLVNPKLLPSSKAVAAIADRAERGPQ